IEAARGFIPTFLIVKDRQMLYLAIGILGATVMPHNLYLHSSIVQTRAFNLTPEGKREAVRFATLDSTIALGLSLFINAAILVLGAAAFHVRGMSDVADISQAYQLLTPVLGVSLASVLFAAALLCSGQNSTLTGTLAGQICMEGFLHWRVSPWLRRLITRSMAIIPAALVIGIMGESHTTSLLILSQVVLSFQLPFAVVPLIQFTSDRSKMGEFTNGTFTTIFGWFMAAAIIVLNGALLWLTFGGKL
ncbi:MAG TPA: divalent metal cation transporter, partial [Candidatus Saccharimonadales bacterium]|nr:divalent metal cation transporter [Candidatus Saccharimonadales bacterium]